MSQNKIKQQVEDKILESYESMYRIAFTYVKNADDAMDVVQDSAYKAIKYAASVKKEQYIETWIYKIVINCAIDFIKKTRKKSLPIFRRNWNVLPLLKTSRTLIR